MSRTRRNAVIQETEEPEKKNKEASPEKTRKQRRFRRPATTGHIELIAVAQAKQVKLVLLGATNVGKTALCVRFMTKRFISEYSKEEMRYNHFTFVDNEIAYFDVLDTSYTNAMENHDLYENKLKWGDAFIILYDINDPLSFEEVTRIRYLISYLHTPQRLDYIKNKVKEKITHAKEDREEFITTDCWYNPPVVLIGTKSDERTEDSIPTDLAKVKAQELECGFEEISNKDSSHDDVRQIFNNLYRSVRAQSYRPRNQKDIKLHDVAEFSDPKVAPHSSPTLDRRKLEANDNSRFGRYLTARKDRLVHFQKPKSMSLGLSS